MQAYKILSLNIGLYRGKQMLDLVNVLSVDRVSYLRKFSDPWEQTAESPFESKAEKAHKHSPLHGKSAHSVSRPDGSQWSSYPRQLNIQRWFTSRLYRRASHSHPVPVWARGCHSCTVQLRPSNMGYTCAANTSLLALHVLFYSIFPMANELLKSTRDRKRAVVLTPRKCVEGSSKTSFVSK